MPRYSRESAVTFSTKCTFAAPGLLFGFFSTIATDVSSLEMRCQLVKALTRGSENAHQEVSMAKVNNPLYLEKQFLLDAVRKHVRKVAVDVRKFSILR